MAPKRYREKVVGWILNQNYSKVCLFLERRMVSLPSLPNPLLTVPAFQTRKGGRRKREDGFKDARYSPPQLSASEAELPSHPPQEIRTQSQPLPRRFPQCAPSPPLQHRPGRQDGFQPGTAAVFLLRLSWLPQPESRLCSLRLCSGPFLFPPPPRLRLGTTPGSGPRGGRTQWAQVGPRQSPQVERGFPSTQWGCLGCG